MCCQEMALEKGVKVGGTQMINTVKPDPKEEFHQVPNDFGSKVIFHGRFGSSGTAKCCENRLFTLSHASGTCLGGPDAHAGLDSKAGGSFAGEGIAARSG